jgi:hypothetical protein
MEIIRKIGYGVVLILVALLIMVKLVIPAIGIWIVLTPVIIAAVVALFGFFLGGFLELLKIVVKVLSIALFIYLLAKLFV